MTIGQVMGRTILEMDPRQPADIAVPAGPRRRLPLASG